MLLKSFAVLFMLLLAGCAARPTASDQLVLDPPRKPTDRLNGQPRLWPCMVGDMLCSPLP